MDRYIQLNYTSSKKVVEAFLASLMIPQRECEGVTQQKSIVRARDKEKDSFRWKGRAQSVAQMVGMRKLSVQRFSRGKQCEIHCCSQSA